jgi:hypothetical protein
MEEKSEPASGTSKFRELEGLLDENGERSFCFNRFIMDRSSSLVMVMRVRDKARNPGVRNNPLVTEKSDNVLLTNVQQTTSAFAMAQAQNIPESLTLCSRAH